MDELEKEKVDSSVIEVDSKDEETSKHTKKTKKHKKPKKEKSKKRVIIILLICVILLLILLGTIFFFHRYQEKQKEEYIDSIFSVSDDVKKLMKEQSLEYEEGITYYIDASSLSKDTFKISYLIYSKKDGKDYYAWTSLDHDNRYIPFTLLDELNYDDVVENSKKQKVSVSKGFSWSEKIVSYDNEWNPKETNPGYEMEKIEADACFTYETQEEKIMITGYKDSCSKEVEIPSMIDSVPVVAVAPMAFYQKGITSVLFYQNLETIGDSSFAYNEISKVVFPSTIKEISAFAFYENKLESVSLSSSLTKISEYAFAKNKITSITIPKSVVEIGDFSFFQNEITEITIAGSPKFGMGSFSQNKMPEDIAFIYGYDKNGKIDYTTIVGYGGSSKKVEIPLTKEKVNLETIGKGAFAFLDLESVTIPKSVKVISSSAFFHNQLTTVSLPSSLNVIGAEAFRSNQLTSFQIPNSVIFIGTGAFIDNQMEDKDAFIYRRTMNGIDYSSIVSYAGKKRSEVVIPKTVNKVNLTSIDGFYSSGLISFEIPDTVTFIANGAFNDNLVEKGQKNEYVYARSKKGWDYSKIVSYAGKEKNITIPSEMENTSLKTISSYAFASCDLVSVVIPNTVEKIEQNAFLKNRTSNVSFHQIKNTTGNAFAWDTILGGVDTSKFELGTVSSSYGTLEIIK